MLEPKRRSDQEIATVLFSPIGDIGISRLGKKCLVPVDLLRKLLNLFRRHARRVHRSDDASHAGARNAIDRDMIFFHPPNYANFSETQRASTAECQPDDWTSLCGPGFLSG